MRKHNAFVMRAACLALCLVMGLSLIPGLLFASAEDNAESKAGELTGETSRTTKELTLSDGTKTGALWTSIELSGYYGEKQVNIAEFSMNNTHLSLEVINSGTYIHSVATTANASKSYTDAHKGETVLAAVNGDLWMTKVHANSAVTTEVLRATRGSLIIDGEIWASQQIDMENYAATNAEKGTGAGDKAAFGVTFDNQPLIGSPDIKVKLTVNGDTEIMADGFNRLPCMNSLIVYNWRVNSSNCALNDAYEIAIDMEKSSAFNLKGDISGKVTAIYPKNSEQRPKLNKRTVILTARGSAVAKIQDVIKVGDTVSFTTTLTDRWGRTELWQNVKDAIGGHMQVLVDGKAGVANGDTSEYPTCLIGYADDGRVMLTTITSKQNGKYVGLQFSKAYKLCTELGYNSVFYLDGGGSTSFVTLEEGTYTTRNNCSDGSPRSVINSVGIVWHDTPVCEKQGSLSYIEIPPDYSAIPAYYLDGALVADLVGAPNAVTIGYDAEEKAFAMTTSTKTNDPYCSLNVGPLQPLDVTDYPYMVFKVKSTLGKASTFKLYYAAGSNSGASESFTKTFQVPGDDEWHYILIDMSKDKGWKGTLHNIRLDIFDSSATEAGMTMYIGAIAFCEYEYEAIDIENGGIPDGAIGDYLAYKESLKPATEPETDPPTEPETDPETDPETETEPVVETEPETQTVAETEAEIPTEPATDPETQADAPTTAETEEVTQAETDAQSSSGCQSVLTVSAILMSALCGTFVCLVGKRKGE